jgi:hypothetical protein
MTALLRSEAKAVFRDFLGGKITPKEFEVWIISCIDELPATEQAPLWDMRLLLIEYGEGLRSLEEAKERAEELLAEDAA